MMSISPQTAITALTILLSLLILTVSAWNLYLSHYKEQRSEVDLLPEETDSKPAFGGGNHAIGDSAFWTGNFNLKVVNTGVKGAYIAEESHSIIGLKKNDQISNAENVSIEVNPSRSGWAGRKIEPRSSNRYRVHVRIEPEEDIGVFVDHDSATIRHSLRVEDNKGSYEVTYETEMRLVGPEGALENWKSHEKSE